MANVGTFPLLKLPYLPIANVIQQFDSILERVNFATLSKRTAILVKSLKDIKVLGLKLTVSSDLKLKILRLGNEGRIEQGWTFPRDIDTPDFPFLVDYNRLKQLINTLFFIFGLSGFEKLEVAWEENGTLDIGRLQNLLGDLKTIKFYEFYSTEFFDRVLAVFPMVKNVSMMGRPKNEVLIQNLGILKLSTPSLDDLLLVNCESLEILTVGWPEKDLNRFLMIWTRGGNPRLKHLRVHWEMGTVIDRNVIFKAIQYQNRSQDRKMTFKSYSLNVGKPETTEVLGGMNIKTKRGYKATITNESGNGFGLLSWDMNVWD